MSGGVVELVAMLAGRGERVAVAESLTGGRLAAAFTSVPGSSAVFQGGVVAYQSEVKADLLGVSRELLARPGGAVQAEVAAQMAAGVRRLFSAQWGVATTGVAGPSASDGQPVGTVFVAVDGPSQRVIALSLSGDRAQVQGETVDRTLTLLADALSDVGTDTAPGEI